MSKVSTALAAIPLGEAAVIDGVRVVRRSLLGFQVEGRRELVDVTEAAGLIPAGGKSALTTGPRAAANPGPRRRPIVRVIVCTRCGGDGLGRRNRGVCGLCHGPGIQVVEPGGGWSNAQADDLASGVGQALSALRAAAYPKARESLLALLEHAVPGAPATVRERAVGELRRAGFEASVKAIAAAGPPRAA